MNNIEQIYVSWANSLDSAGEDPSLVLERLNSKVTLLLIQSLMEFLTASDKLEQLKKHIFYGKENTDSGYLRSLGLIPVGIDVSKNIRQNPELVRLLHATLGLIGESGEITDVVKDVLTGLIPFDAVTKDKLMNEAGDVMWYQAVLQKALGHTSFAEVLTANHAKLTQRYGTQWSQEAALNRIEGGDIDDQQTRLG